MKERKLYIKNGIVASLFLLIMGGIVVNSTFFLHAHKNESGKIIFHAHPFDKGAEKEDPLAKHQHKKIDLDYISSIEHYLITENYISLEFNGKFELELTSKPCIYSDSNIYSLYTTRGPPQKPVLV